MKFDKITPDNFLIYATKKYDANQAADIEEFNTDLRRFSSIKRLLLRFARDKKSVNTRMLLNHIIIISNLFGNEATPKLLFFYCPVCTHSFLRSFLDFLYILPTHAIQETDSDTYPIDETTINILKGL